MLQNPFTQMPEAPSIDDKPVSRASNAGKTSPAEQGLEIPMGWKATPKEPVPVVRCTGVSTTTGERCKRWSLRGATVCRKHGGQLSNVREHAEAVVESARLQLMGMADDAVDVLDDILQNGTSEQVRLKAVEMVLNRSGIKDAVDLNIEVNHTVSAAEEIRKKLSAITERMKADEPEDIIDAEEVTDEEKE